MEGDVVLFKGNGPFAKTTQMIDGCEYDHSALVVSAEPNDRGPRLAHVTFGSAHNGAQVFNLRDYKDGEEPVQVQVRRHLFPGAGPAAGQRADVLVGQVTGYSMDRLIAIVLSSLVRFSAPLATIASVDPPRARGLAFGILKLFRSVHPGDLNPHDCVCSDLIFDSYDTDIDPTATARTPYAGLVMPTRAVGGLLAWIASAKEFDQYLIEQLSSPRTRQDDPEAVSPADARVALHGMYLRYGVSFVGTPDEVSEAALKREVVDAALALAKLVHPRERRRDGPAVAPPEPVPDTDTLWPAWAFRLLEQFFSRRFITSVGDLHETKSLAPIQTFILT